MFQTSMKENWNPTTIVGAGLRPRINTANNGRAITRFTPESVGVKRMMEGRTG